MAIVVRDLEKCKRFYSDEKIPDTMRHFAMEVEDFRKTVEHLAARGIAIVDGPGKRVDGSDYLFCKDPEGNLIEVTHH
jgi:catechol 2,3-dioxygenase-like lactoylglutathione lyase family enzyme